MSIDTTAYVWLDDSGTAWIDQTNIKVIEVVLDKLAHGSSPEEIHFPYPHLSLAQVHAALSFYYDHQVDLDSQIERRMREVEMFQASQGDSPVRQKLRALGKL